MRGTYSGVNSPEATITQSAATERTYYEYSISLNPTSASFSATGESKSFTVTSQRRLVTVNSVSGTTYGSWGSTGWEIYPTNLGTGFSQTTSGNTITVKASANSGSSRSGTLSIRCTGDTSETASANLSQSGASTTTTTEYEFTVSPTSPSFTKDGGSQTISIVSRSRPKYINDVSGEVSYGNWSAVSYTASSTNSAFSSTTPTGTGTNNASVSVGTNSGEARSATITYTQSGSGTKKTVSCSQAVGTQTRTVRDYSFSVNPTSLNFDASGGTKSVTVSSQYRDGTQSSTDGGNNWSSTSWGSWQTASYTGTVDNTGGGAFSGSGNSVTAGANSSTSRREGNLKLSQPRSGIQENGNSWPSPSNINVRLNQDGKPKSRYVIRFDGNFTLQNQLLSNFSLIATLEIKFSDNSTKNILTTMQVHASNLRPGDTENELYLEFPFYKDKESITITKMILTFTDLIYAEEKDNGRDLHFYSANNKYNFSFGYFSKNDLPTSINIRINNGNLIMSGGSTEKIFFKMSSDI